MKKKINISTRNFVDKYFMCMPAYLAIFVFVACAAILMFACPNVMNSTLFNVVFGIGTIGGVLYVVSGIVLDALTDTCWNIF